MYRLYFTIILWCVAVQPLKAYSDEVFTELGISLVTESLLLTPDNTEVSPYLTPELSIGVGLENSVSDSWRLESKLTATYSRFDVTDISTGVVRNGENTGLWLDNTLYYQGLSENVEPFVGVSVGRVKSDVSGEVYDRQQWATGHKVVTGLNFDLNENANLSIAVGTGEFNH